MRTPAAASSRPGKRNLTTDVDALLLLGRRQPHRLDRQSDNLTGSMLPRKLRWSAYVAVSIKRSCWFSTPLIQRRSSRSSEIKLVDAGENTATTRTFSKVFDGGLRVGLRHAPAGVVDVLNLVRAPFNVSVAAQEPPRSR